MAVDEGERLDALPLARLEERLVLAARQAPSPRSARARPRAARRGGRRAGAPRRRRAGGRRPRRARTRRRARRRARCCPAASTASSSTRARTSARRRRGAVRRRPRRSCPQRRGASKSTVTLGSGVSSLVAERDLVAGQAGAAARAVRGDAVVAEDQVVRSHSRWKHPPAGLDVLVRVGHVRLVGVDPEADALGHPLPVGDVAEHRLAALRVEGGDAVLLDLALVAQSQLALDLELDGQAVRVPAALAGRAVAAHRLVARDQVLEDAREDVVHAGRPVRRRRPLVEREELVGRALLDAAPEDVAARARTRGSPARDRGTRLAAGAASNCVRTASPTMRGRPPTYEASTTVSPPCGTSQPVGPPRCVASGTRAGWRRRFTPPPGTGRARPSR